MNKNIYICNLTIILNVYKTMEMEYNCKYTGKRCAHTWSIMDGEATITVLRPYSGEFKDKEQ